MLLLQRSWFCKNQELFVVAKCALLNYFFLIYQGFMVGLLSKSDQRVFNQGYVLMKGIEKVGGEISLTMLVYNLKRVINIIGARNLIVAVR